MRQSPSLPFASIFASMVLMGSLAVTPSAFTQATPPDNSAQNKQSALTADQQSNSANDRLTTQKIRKAVIADKDLSTYGHNVKIIVKQGQVTLKGPVHSDDEKQKIQSLAAQVAGADKVTNDITVKTE